MKRSNRLVIFVGVLLAILAFIGIVILLQSSSRTTQEQTSKVTVLVAKENIAIGDPVTPDIVDEKKVDPSAVTGTPFGSASQLLGRPALIPIPAGSQVYQEAIVGSATIDELVSKTVMKMPTTQTRKTTWRCSSVGSRIGLPS